MMGSNNKHTFVICVYKESLFLERCIISLKTQTVKSKIIMVTSTPCDFLSEMAGKYNIPLYINTGEKGIVQDWNFGYDQCRTPYVTIAHQDDIYFRDYAKTAISMMENSRRPLIFFSDYCEIRNEKLTKCNRLLRIKRIMLTPLRIRGLRKNKFVRRRCLSVGNCICCPSVTFAVKNLPNPVFHVRFRSNEDWEAWEKLSKLNGEFLYCPKILMGHRIHEESETSIIIGENARGIEDYEMFCKFWPRWIAKLLVKIYSKSEKSNEIK